MLEVHMSDGRVITGNLDTFNVNAITSGVRYVKLVHPKLVDILTGATEYFFFKRRIAFTNPALGKTLSIRVMYAGAVIDGRCKAFIFNDQNVFWDENVDMSKISEQTRKACFKPSGS